MWSSRSRAFPRRLVIGVVALTIGLVAFVAVWFQPQKLWIDDEISEPVPAGVSTRPGRQDAATVQPPVPTEVARGAFVSRDHRTSGTVRVLAHGDGRRVVRLEALDTSNGPDLYVYLVANRADGPEQAFDDDYISLGRLKGNQGDQNYEVPADADLQRLSTVLIWCDRFNSAFGAADLTLA
jgi:hypothetical protein